MSASFAQARLAKNGVLKPRLQRERTFLDIKQGAEDERRHERKERARPLQQAAAGLQAACLLCCLDDMHAAGDLRKQQQRAAQQVAGQPVCIRRRSTPVPTRPDGC